MSPADKWVDTLTPTNDHLPMQQQPGGFGPPPAGFGNPPPAGFGASPSPYGGPPAGGFGPGQFPAPPPLPRQTHTMAIVSLVAGIVSWFMCPFIGGTSPPTPTISAALPRRPPVLPARPTPTFPRPRRHDRWRTQRYRLSLGWNLVPVDVRGRIQPRDLWFLTSSSFQRTVDFNASSSGCTR